MIHDTSERLPERFGKFFFGGGSKWFIAQLSAFQSLQTVVVSPLNFDWIVAQRLYSYQEYK